MSVPPAWSPDASTPGVRRAARARHVVLGLLVILTSMLASCHGWRPPPYERRLAAAEDGLTADPAIEGRRDQVTAALARERAEVAFDEVEFRVQEDYDGDDHGVRLRARVPIPNPGELRARRRARRAETDAALALFEDAALSRRAELCRRAIESLSHAERTTLYAAYAERQRAVLEWNAEWARAGSLSEQAATRFEIETRIKLATRRPGPAPPPVSLPLALPPPIRPPQRLIRSPEIVRELIRANNPAVAVHDARSERYRALSKVADSERLPWLRFIDLTYEPLTRGDSDQAGGTQVAVRVPFGAGPRAAADRFQALSNGSLQEGSAVLADRTRVATVALDELDHFETNAGQWQELAELARRADGVAARWSRERLAKPADVADLTDRAYAARMAVLEAQTTAAAARCRLLAATGVAAEDWPREEPAR